jgi:hypothetical protein
MLVVALLFALAVPAAAFAKGGPPDHANGKAKGKAPVATPVAPEAEEAAEEPAPAPVKEKKAKKVKAGVAASEGVEDPEADEGDGDEVAPEPEAKLTGIANALSRLQANLARKQADLDAGKRSHLPMGLQKAIEKFMGWLGITPEEPPVDVVEPGEGDEVPDPGDGDGVPEDGTPDVPDETGGFTDEFLDGLSAL